MTATEAIFVDTNILLYTVDLDAGSKHYEAIRVVSDLWNRGAGAISTQVLQEFHVNATRKLRRPLQPAEARELIAEYAEWTVHTITPQDVMDASRLHEADTVSFWDALIVVAAQRAGATVLLSEDLQHGRRFGTVTVRNPFL